MNKTNKMVGVLAVLAATLLVSMALPATADKDEGKTHKEPEKTTYVGLGIGDNYIICPGDVESIDTITVNNPVTGLPLVGPINLGTPAVAEPACLGGATGPYTLGGHTWWEVWIHDYVWNGCAGKLAGTCGAEWSGVDDLLNIPLRTAGFARIQMSGVQEYTKGDTTHTQQCLLDEGSFPGATNVCVVTPGATKTSVKNLYNFGFCGQGAVPINEDDFDFSKLGKNFDETAIEKQVFVDGFAFYQLDCPLLTSVTGDLSPLYGTVRDTVNSVTCNPNNAIPEVLCVFNLPASGSTCLLEENAAGISSLGVIGIVGEIGWHHPTEEPDCVEKDWFHDEWVTTQGPFTIVIKNVPVEITTSPP